MRVSRTYKMLNQIVIPLENSLILSQKIIILVISRFKIQIMVKHYQKHPTYHIYLQTKSQIKTTQTRKIHIINTKLQHYLISIQQQDINQVKTGILLQYSLMMIFNQDKKRRIERVLSLIKSTEIFMLINSMIIYLYKSILLFLDERTIIQKLR